MLRGHINIDEDLSYTTYATRFVWKWDERVTRISCADADEQARAMHNSKLVLAPYFRLSTSLKPATLNRRANYPVASFRELHCIQEAI